MLCHSWSPWSLVLGGPGLGQCQFSIEEMGSPQLRVCCALSPVDLVVEPDPRGIGALAGTLLERALHQTQVVEQLLGLNVAMSPSSASTARSLADVSEYEEVSSHLAVGLESTDEGTSAQKSLCDEVTRGDALSVVVATGLMATANVGATEIDQLVAELGVPTSPSPGGALVIDPFALTLLSPGKATVVVESPKE